MKHILVIGATSKMIEETLKQYVIQGDRLFLVARNAEKLKTLALHLQAYSNCSHPIETWTGSLCSPEHQELFIQEAFNHAPVDLALIAYGDMPDQTQAEQDPQIADRSWEVNASSIGHCALLLANRFEMQKHGKLAVITSVAGERGRRKNYIYGASKAFLSHLLAGLRIRLEPSNVQVLDIRPGFIKTPMTAHLRQGGLFISAQKAGTLIHEALEGNDGVVYVPGFWQWIMLTLKHLPYFIFKRLPI